LSGITIAAILALPSMFVYAPFLHADFWSAPLIWSTPLAIGDILKRILVGTIIVRALSVEKSRRNRG